MQYFWQNIKETGEEQIAFPVATTGRGREAANSFISNVKVVISLLLISRKFSEAIFDMLFGKTPKPSPLTSSTCSESSEGISSGNLPK